MIVSGKRLQSCGVYFYSRKPTVRGLKLMFVYIDSKPDLFCSCWRYW